MEDLECTAEGGSLFSSACKLRKHGRTRGRVHAPTCLANDRSALMATADRENCFEDWIASPAYWAALATCRTATERHLCQTVCKATTAAVFLFFLDRINYVELSRNEWKCRVSVRFADDGLFMCTSHMNKLYRIVLSMEYKGWSNTDHLTWTTSTVSRNSMLFLKKMSIYFYLFFSFLTRIIPLSHSRRLGTFIRFLHHTVLPLSNVICGRWAAVRLDATKKGGRHGGPPLAF